MYKVRNNNNNNKHMELRLSFLNERADDTTKKTEQCYSKKGTKFNGRLMKSILNKSEPRTTEYSYQFSI